MTTVARYCTQCAATLVRRVVEGAEREVCPACGFVAYRNPLPVAAAVVLNARREVLLVRRRNEPHVGMWCLPIGFAEVRETIAEAALRELHEEAGITGRVLRLLDADSFISDHYGDLLTVTFEVEKTGGSEVAGDDAAEVGYFTLDDRPPLAFAANEKAIEACRRAHADDWAIQDSFALLEREQPSPLLSDALLTLVRDRAVEVARLWGAEVRGNSTTRAYGRLDEGQLAAEAAAVLARFSHWWSGDDVRAEVRAFFRALGARRRAGGVELHEILSALMLLRKTIWTYARDQGVWERPIDLYRGLELDRRLVLFFDRAIYHASRGYAEDAALAAGGSS